MSFTEYEIIGRPVRRMIRMVAAMIVICTIYPGKVQDTQFCRRENTMVLSMSSLKFTADNSPAMLLLRIQSCQKLCLKNSTPILQADKVHVDRSAFFQTMEYATQDPMPPIKFMLISSNSICVNDKTWASYATGAAPIFLNHSMTLPYTTSNTPPPGPSRSTFGRKPL